MDREITSLQNQRIKDAAKLRTRKGRDMQRRFLIDGGREIARAIAGGVEVQDLFYCPDRVSDAQQVVLSEARHSGVHPTVVSEQVFGKLAFGERDEGVVAIAKTRPHALDALHLADNPLIVVAEAIEKPGNVGAMLRTADASGVDAVVLCDPVSDVYNPNTIRASLGAVFTVSLAVATARDVIDWLREHSISIFATRVSAESDYRRASFTGPLAIAMGAESTGLSEVWTGDDVRAISLPMLGVVDSLNISVTAGILMYEALRQRSA